jgi:hypothetical protein
MRLRPVADFNPVLRGWSAYFRNGDSGRRLNAVDRYVHEQLAIIPGRKHGLAGRNWTTHYSNGRPDRLGIFRLTGNAHWATACQEVDDARKPYAGRPCARQTGAEATVPAPDLAQSRRRTRQARWRAKAVAGSARSTSSRSVIFLIR